MDGDQLTYQDVSSRLTKELYFRRQKQLETGVGRVMLIKAKMNIKAAKKGEL